MRARGAMLAAAILACSSALDAGEPPTDSAREEAKARFERGLGLLRDDALEAALAEFTASRRLVPTRGNTRNAAVVLRKLHRFDESLDMFEALERDFPDGSPDDQASIRREIDELRGLVGALDVALDEPGATVLVDGRERGQLPLARPLRVSAGEHVVRVLRDGRAPFEARVSVAGGQSTRLGGKMVSIAALGRLRVEEASGAGLDVLLDGRAVGRTPWEGAVAAGAHIVALRGPAETGSAPVDATVQADDTRTLRIAAVRLDARLRVEAATGVTLALDGVSVGAAPYEASLPSGRHRLAAREGGVTIWESEITLRPSEPMTVRVAPRKTDAFSRYVLSLDAGGAIGRSLGGELAASCTSPCERGLLVAVLARLGLGYRLTPPLSIGAEVGFVGAGQSLSNRADVISPNGRAAAPGAVSDDLKLRAFLLGAFAGYKHGERFGFQARLGFGVAPASVRDARRGQYVVDQTLVAAASTSTGNGLFLYAAPEVRVGVALGPRTWLSAGVTALFLSPIDTPKREATRDEVLLSTGDLAGHPATTVAGATLLVAPTVGLAFTP